MLWLTRAGTCPRRGQEFHWEQERCSAMVVMCHRHPRREQLQRDLKEEEEGRMGCRPRAEVPLRQHLSWSRDTPVAQGRACARTGRRGRREKQPEGAGRDSPQPISIPTPLGVMGKRKERFILTFFFFFSLFKPILIDNTCNVPHYVSGLPVTVIDHWCPCLNLDPWVFPSSSLAQ